jgi:hypothetical protein
MSRSQRSLRPWQAFLLFQDEIRDLWEDDGTPEEVGEGLLREGGGLQREHPCVEQGEILHALELDRGEVGLHNRRVGGDPDVSQLDAMVADLCLYVS